MKTIKKRYDYIASELARSKRLKAIMTETEEERQERIEKAVYKMKNEVIKILAQSYAKKMLSIKK